ncbi:MAG: hypothetical protein ACOCWC_02875 [Bacteroidota bacterium]
MRLSIIAFIVLFSSFQITSHAKENQDNNEKFKHYLGVGAGLTTGHGISYRFWPEVFGAQLTFAPYKDANSINYNIGFTFLFKIIKTDITNFFIYQGNRYFYEKHEAYDNSGEESISSNLNNGIGIGIEFIIWDRVSFNIMGGYASYDNFDKINFTGEAGLYYIF